MLIKDLDMSERTTNCLLRSGIESTEQLCCLTETEVLKLRNLGRMSFQELLSKMHELELRFKPEI